MTIADTLRILRTRMTRSAAAFVRSHRGLAGIEFGIIASVLAVSLLNTADLAIYLYDRVQVENATEMGAQAALKTCDVNHLPATTNCTGFATAVTNAVQGTSLGTHVTVVSGYPAEAYYCVNSSGVLVQVATVAQGKPSDCSSVSEPTYKPGDWIKVQTTYTYTPLFTITVVSVLGTTIQRTSWMRID